jgi:hypothetical protein
LTTLRRILMGAGAAWLAAACGADQVAGPSVDPEATQAALARAGLPAGEGIPFPDQGTITFDGTVMAASAFQLEFQYDGITGPDVNVQTQIVAWADWDDTDLSFDRLIMTGMSALGSDAVDASVGEPVPIMIPVPFSGAPPNPLASAQYVEPRAVALWRGREGYFLVESLTFDGDPQPCEFPGGYSINGQEVETVCEARLGHIVGSFNFEAVRVAGSGPDTYTQPTTSYNLAVTQIRVRLVGSGE